MSEILIKMGKEGANKLLELTRQSLEKITIQEPEAKIGFPDTNYSFPLINALLNKEVKTIKDCKEVFSEIENLSKGKPTSTGINITSMEGIFNLGISVLLCEEILAGIAVLNKEHPKEGIGFVPDKILRSLGLQLVDGRISAIAVILGPAKDTDLAVELVRSLQAKNIVSFLVGSVEGNSFRKQLESKNIEIGLENYIVPLGEDYLSALYAVNFAIRAPLIFGGFKPGQWKEIMDYIRRRVPAFVLLLSYVDEIIVATGLGVLAFGIPIITDLDVPQIPKIETTLYEAIVTEKDYKKITNKCILTRGIKVKVADVDLPVPYAPAFEGERVRKENLYVEFGGKSSCAFEFLTTKDVEEIEDGKIEVFGPEIDKLEPDKKSMPLAIIVEVAGRRMQKDFEPILERQIHRFINYCMGVMHVGQRDMNWIRISKDAYNKGLRLKHLGVAIHKMLHSEYSVIIDKVQIKFYTKIEDVKELLLKAKKAYEERDARISGMTDEKVDVFYSCLLCQSFAPNHVCIITPERVGLCGAYSWLDAKASYELMPSGPNQPIFKGEVLEQRLGQWKNINEFVYEKSNRTIEKVSMYSLIDYPQSSCGCFEGIVAIVPEANGVLLVHRDYSGLTPLGINFTTLAGSVGGGVQTPGFLGIAKLYILSKKFISAEGGLLRVVWMPKELKEEFKEKLMQRAKELNYPDLIDKIADETTATTIEELLEFLTKVNHPALSLPPLI